MLAIIHTWLWLCTSLFSPSPCHLAGRVPKAGIHVPTAHYKCPPFVSCYQNSSITHRSHRPLETIRYRLHWLSRILHKVLTSDMASCTQARHRVMGNHVIRKQMKLVRFSIPSVVQYQTHRVGCWATLQPCSTCCMLYAHATSACITNYCPSNCEIMGTLSQPKGEKQVCDT